ncbi:hypothetical protein, variant [Saprolegnia diclina VS20]|nr:hypothetical protein, variant [Saprolegnia diclina VS20]EQC40006.1 hypothetical protein, variant [Saprolegnia diclina VS20]|eukprot:XP_008606480.1 hypothetical protein, variant [Saprolegnia diclina VS20]
MDGANNGQLAEDEQDRVQKAVGMEPKSTVEGCDNDDDDMWAQELERELALDVHVKKRGMIPFHLPHEVLMVLMSMVSVGRVCRSWSLAAAEVTRSKYRNIFEGLFLELLADDATGAIALARTVEDALHAFYGLDHGCFVPKAYKEKARMLKFNLRDPKNALLRTRLFQGDLSVDALVRMRSSDMANPLLVQQRKEWIKKRTREVTRNMRDLSGFMYSTDLFNCPSCGSNETQHSQGRRKAMADRVCIVVICCK